MNTYEVSIEMQSYGFTCILKSIRVKPCYKHESSRFLYQDGHAFYYRTITKLNENN